MNEDSLDYKLSQLPFSLEELTNMSNMFSKEDLEDEDDDEQENEDPEGEFESVVKFTMDDSEDSSHDETYRKHSNKVIRSMLTEVCCRGLTPQQTWSGLQHYIYFFYRHVVAAKPYNNGDNIPEVVSKNFSEMLEILLHLDATQVFMKLVILLRDFVMVAKHHIENTESSDVTTYLVTLMAYYSALCSAAGKIAALLPAFDKVTLEQFNINWIGVNKSIFYHLIYLSISVQSKIPLFNKLHEDTNPKLRGLLETFVCFTQDMQALEAKWDHLKEQIMDISKDRARTNPKHHLVHDWKMYSEHKRIFNSPEWLNRSSKSKKLQDMKQLDAHILTWVADKSLVADSLMDEKGCCLCEDCLGAEFRNNSKHAELAQTFRAETSGNCLVSCHICSAPVILNNLLFHMVEQHNTETEKANGEHVPPLGVHGQHKSSSKDTPKSSLYEGLLKKNAEIQQSLQQLINATASDRNKTVREKKMKESQAATAAKKKSSKTSEDHDKSKHKSLTREADALTLFREATQAAAKATETRFKSSKEALLKLVGESQNGDDELLIQAAASTEECRIFFEQMKKLVEQDVENGRTVNKQKVEHNTTHAVTGSKDVPKISPDQEKASSVDEECQTSETEKSQQKGGNNIDSKILEFLKNANAHAQKIASSPKSNDLCTGHACGHKCKQEEELKKMSCIDSCEHHKDSRRCDCAYCEVFGTQGFPVSTPKPSETRDRLRTRLKQRKEKGNETAIEKNEPPRVPELHHPVPPPANNNATKGVQVAMEVKKSSSASNDKSTITNTPKVPTTCIANSVLESVTDGCSAHRSPSSLSTCSLFSESVDCRDINELLNYIEGNKSVDKVAIAHKKAAKKARQRSKKAQEKEEKELIEVEKRRQKEEARLKEEKLKEEERLKAEVIAKQLAEKQKKKKDEKVHQESKKGNKKKESKHENILKVAATSELTGIDSKLLEETIPAMVTIKRGAEGNQSEATFTITLKGSTTKTNKLLLTLVNGNGSKNHSTTSNKTKTKNNASNKQPIITKIVTENAKTPKKKKEKVNSTLTKAMKVTLAVDKNSAAKKETPAKKPLKMDTFAAHQLQRAFNNTNNKESENSTSKIQGKVRDELSLPMLNLPPGITITKIEGPPNSGSCKYPNSNNSQQPNNANLNHTSGVPSTKSGVIVVDTEKLIQQSIAASINKRDKKMNKKKRDQPTVEKPPPSKPSEHTKMPAPPAMVTLKNPIFENQQPNRQTSDRLNFEYSGIQQASIFKGENGMVTIRSPRLQNPYETGASVSSYFSDPQPVYNSENSSPYVPMQSQPHNFYENSNKSPFSQYNSHYHAHEFLAGLPGIEITKINKPASTPPPPPSELEYDRRIIRPPSKTPSARPVPANNVNGFNSFNFNVDDWYYGLMKNN